MKDILTEIISQFLKSLGRAECTADDFLYEPMKGGGSLATLYRLDVNKYSYVLRLFPLHASPTTRMHQITLAKQAGEMGCGPKIHFVDSQMNGMIMEFIPGRTVKESDFSDAANLAEFAKFLQRLHSSKANFPLAVSPFKRFHDFFF